MSNNLTKQKSIEKDFNEKYFDVVYKQKPNYINSGLDIPDCYIEAGGTKYAVELTTYFMQDDEKRTAILKRNIAKLLVKDNWICEAYKHIGKTKNQTIYIHYRKKEDMINDILKAKDYIKYITIGNNDWFNNKKENGNISCYINSVDRYGLTLDEFLENVNFIESNEKSINIGLFNKKNRSSFSAKLVYNKYTINKKNKCVDYSYVYWENDEEKCKSIKKSIDKKIDKYAEYKNKLKENNVFYDKYVLIIYPEQYPIDIEDFSELYNNLKNQIEDLKYDEIAIFLFNKILVINNAKYIVYDT